MASELVEADPRYDGVVRFLLGRIAVVDDLDTAVTISRKYGYKFRIVTLDGQQVNVGGSFTGGSAAKNAGVLSRKNEAASLEAEAQKLAGQKALLDGRAQELGREIASLEAHIEGIRAEQIDLIGSHGQTFWHIPLPETYLGHSFRSTFQLGEGSVLAQRFGCPVVSDFRVRDVAADGLGAPLVLYSEFLIYRSETECVALQNIGGIGNITCLLPACRLEDVFAFDTGPGNMVIDAVISRLTNGRMTYDDGGAMAAQGKLHPELLRWMMDDPYLSKKPPKTTGRELYGPVYIDRLMEKAGTLNVAPADLLHTVTRFTAETIAYGLRRFSPQMPQRLIVGGGGSLNRCLMEQLRQVLPECRVMTNEDLGLNSSAKEAVAFAVLANETIFASCNNARSATGARHPVVMGKSGR